MLAFKKMVEKDTMSGWTVSDESYTAWMCCLLCVERCIGVSVMMRRKFLTGLKHRCDIKSLRRPL